MISYSLRVTAPLCVIAIVVAIAHHACVAANQDDTETVHWKMIHPRTRPNESRPLGHPDHRYSHGAVYYDGYMWIFYGYYYGGSAPILLGDIWKFHIETNTWIEVHPRVSGPLPRMDHCLVSDDAGHFYLFAGTDVTGTAETYAQSAKDRQKNLSQVWKYDVANNSWSVVSSSSGRSPVIREQMACALIDHSLYVFGGMTSDPIAIETSQVFILNDTWEFNLNDGIWTELTPHTSPKPLYGLSGAVVKGKMVFFGGCNLQDASDQLWALDSVSKQWELFFEGNQEISSNDSPSRRCHAPVIAADESSVWIVGGGTRDQKKGLILVNDVWGFNLDSKSWLNILRNMNVPSNSNYPIVRYRHSAVVVAKLRVVLVFGGESYTTGHIGYYNDVWRLEMTNFHDYERSMTVMEYIGFLSGNVSRLVPREASLVLVGSAGVAIAVVVVVVLVNRWRSHSHLTTKLD